MFDFNSIIVKERLRKRVEIVKNPTNYKFIGKGAQGAVFKLSSERCVKIFANPKHKILEEKVLRDAKGSPFFPQTFEIGENYIVMEYINGDSLDKYLKKETLLPKWLTKQLLLMIQEMKRLNLTRHDARLRHIYVLENEKKVKVIDHVNSGSVIVPKPVNLFRGLKKYGVLDEFLKETEKIDKDSYNEWKKSMSKYFL